MEGCRDASGHCDGRPGLAACIRVGPGVCVQWLQRLIAADLSGWPHPDGADQRKIYRGRSLSRVQVARTSRRAYQRGPITTALIQPLPSSTTPTGRDVHAGHFGARQQRVEYARCMGLMHAFNSEATNQQDPQAWPPLRFAPDLCQVMRQTTLARLTWTRGCR